MDAETKAGCRAHDIALDIVAARADWSLPENRALFSKETLIEACLAFAAEQHAALLEACQALIQYDERDDEGANAGIQMMIDYDHALTLARAAIHSATGGSQ